MCIELCCVSCVQKPSESVIDMDSGPESVPTHQQSASLLQKPKQPTTAKTESFPLQEMTVSVASCDVYIFPTFYGFVPSVV